MNWGQAVQEIRVRHLEPERTRGDAGNDRLKSGIGGSILLGGDRNDELIGGSGRSILIGGSGRDRLIGGSGEDLLIGGSTVYDAAFLCGLLDEWNSVDEYAVRVTRLQPLLLATVIDDEEVDTLIGSSGLDWFYTGVGDRAGAEYLNDQGRICDGIGIVRVEFARPATTVTSG